MGTGGALPAAGLNFCRARAPQSSFSFLTRTSPPPRSPSLPPSPLSLNLSSPPQRGTVSVGKVAERDEEGPGPSKLLVAFFCFVVLGSVVVPVFSLFGRSPLPP